MIFAKVIDDKRLRECAFPVVTKLDTTDPKKVKEYEVLMRRKIHGIPSGPSRLIRNLQPHLMTDPSSHFLAQIDDLDNTDKHRLLLALVSGVDVGPRWTVENRQFLDRQNRQFPAAETGEFYFDVSSVRKSVWTFVRQLFGPHLSTCA